MSVPAAPQPSEVDMVLLLAIALSFLFPGPWNVVVIVLGVFAEVGEIVWGRRLARRWRPKTGTTTMIGEEAEVVTACRPEGQVRVNGELWKATCEDGADIGDPVRIAAVKRLTLVVVPLPQA
jgi:membrane protein implicated in regulation of membrane protease activity